MECVDQRHPRAILQQRKPSSISRSIGHIRRSIAISGFPQVVSSFFNSFVSSTNPFDTLAAGSAVSSSGERLTPSAPLDYLPKTNEYASISAAYNMNARTTATASASYNYLGYQHDPSLPDLAQPFQQSNSAELSFGLRRSFGPRYSGGVQYAAQMLDAGAGQIKTTGQSVQYTLQFVPTSALRISAMVGPEYTQSTYALVPGGGLSHSMSGWSWIGAATVSWTKGRSQLLASASQLLSLGNQYQGNVRQDLLSLSFERQLAHGIDVNVFGAYSTNSPIFLQELTPRFSNNYLSTGTTVGKTFADRWLLKLTYWYLLQDRPSEIVGPYSGNHNRVALSLSYSLSKPLSR